MRQSSPNLETHNEDARVSLCFKWGCTLSEGAGPQPGSLPGFAAALVAAQVAAVTRRSFASFD